MRPLAAEPLQPLQPQDLVITLLGAYVRPFGDTVWSGGLVTLLGELGFSEGAARVALTRLVRRGLIARRRAGRLINYLITARCERLLVEGDGRIFALGDGRDDGGNWTIVWHQIPEDRRLERSRLGRRLRFLGFGSVQDSVWASPHDHGGEVATLLGDLELAPFATVFLARVGDPTGLPALVARGWDLSGLAERYEAFVEEFSPFVRPRACEELDDSGAFVVRTRLIHLFRGFAQLDPELPEELAPLRRARTRAVQTFRELYPRLAAASQRHFDGAVALPVAAGAG